MHSGAIACFAQCPQDHPNVLASNSWDKTVRLWDSRAAFKAVKILASPELARGEPSTLCFEGSFIHAGVGSSVVELDIRSERKVDKTGKVLCAREDEVNCLAVVEPALVATVDDANRLMLGDQLLHTHEAIPFAVAATQVAGQPLIIAGGFDCRLAFFQLAASSGEEGRACPKVHELDLNDLIRPAYSRAHVYSLQAKGGSTVAALETGHFVVLDNRPPFEVNYCVEAHLTRVVRAVRGKIGEKYCLAAGSKDGSLTFWKESSKRKSASFLRRVDIGAPATWVELGPESIYVAASDNRLQVFRVRG